MIARTSAMETSLSASSFRRFFSLAAVGTLRDFLRELTFELKKNLPLRVALIVPSV
jgi:hypothetical protein